MTTAEGVSKWFLWLQIQLYMRFSCSFQLICFLLLKQLWLTNKTFSITAHNPATSKPAFEEDTTLESQPRVLHAECLTTYEESPSQFKQSQRIEHLPQTDSNTPSDIPPEKQSRQMCFLNLRTRKMAMHQLTILLLHPLTWILKFRSLQTTSKYLQCHLVHSHLKTQFVDKYEMAPGISPQMGGRGMKRRNYMTIQDGICLQ